MSHYTITDIQYQRNGVSGEGFFSVAVDYSETPRGQKTHLIAVMPHKYDEVTDTHRTEPEYTYVIDPLNLDSGWRGDNFGRALCGVVDENSNAAFPTLYPEARKVLPIRIKD